MVLYEVAVIVEIQSLPGFCYICFSKHQVCEEGGELSAEILRLGALSDNCRDMIVAFSMYSLKETT